MDVTIYTDGSYKRNIPAGGWASFLYCPINGQWLVIRGNERDTTINRMEFTSVIEALRILNTKCNVTIISDSQLVVKSINKWIQAWAASGWRTSSGSTCANADLLQQLYPLLQQHNVKAKWVKAHTTRKGLKYIGNDIVDYNAQLMADQLIQS